MLSASEHAQIQKLVDNALTLEDKSALRRDAELALAEVNCQSSQKLLGPSEMHLAELAIEMLTRIECKEKNGGWLFRFKRRFQLTKMYLG